MSYASDSTSQTMSSKALLGFALFLIIIWGSAFTLIGVGVKYISPIWLVVYRLFLGTIFLTIYMLLKGYRFPSLTDTRWLWYGVLGITGMSAPFYLVSTGQVKVDSGLSAILIGSMPIMTIILAHFFTDEKLTLRKFFGFLIGFIGIIILFLPDNLSLNLVADWWEQLLILCAAGFYAITTVAAKRAPETPSTVGAVMMLIAATISAFIATFFIAGFEGSIPASEAFWKVVITVAALGIGSTAIATIVYLYVIDQTGPSVIAKVNYFVPLASVIFGVAFLKEDLSWRMLVAFSIILIGVLISRAKQKPA